MRTLSLDLSSTATGFAIGEPGKPEILGTIERPRLEDWTEAKIYVYFMGQISGICLEHKIELVIGEELNVFRNAKATRILAGLRAVIIHGLFQNFGLEPLFFNSMTYRKAAGMDLRGKEKGLAKRKLLKNRAIELVKQHGLDPKDDNQADAAVLLIASKQLLEV